MLNVSMLAEELEDKIKNLRCIAGTVHFDLIYRNVRYHVSCHDTISYDRIQEREKIASKQKGAGGLTYLQALKNLYRQGVPAKDWRGVDTAYKPKH